MRKMKDSGIEWIGDIPEGWEVNRLKSHIYVKDKKEKYLNQKYIGLENVESWTGKYRESALTPEGLCNVFEKNDILFGKLRPYLAKCIVADFDGLCSTEFIVICSYGGCNKYFKYVLLSQPVIEEITSETYGTKMPRANWEKIGNITLVIPPLSEQQRIADYLDAKCARIDESMELVRQSMEKLRAYKLSLITEAVTKGLDPDVPMKDSGIPWIGEVPEGWGICTLASCVASIESGVSVNAGGEPAKENEFGILKTSCVYGFSFNILENKSVNYDEYCRLKCPVKEGSLIVSRMNTPDLVGACGYVDKSYKNIFLPDRLWQVTIKDSYCSKFIYYYLVSSQVRAYLASRATGTSGSMKNISQKQFVTTPFLCPPLSEQQRIADYLDAKCARIDALLEEKERLLDRLAEYKKSLIFECVTGKREVSA